MEYIVIIMNFILILWLYKKYMYKPAYIGNEYDDINKLDAGLIGYIENPEGNSVDWMLAEILDLNRKGYLEIEYIREDIDKYNYIIRKKIIEPLKLAKYELTVYRLLFENKNEISLKDLEEIIENNIIKGDQAIVKSINIREEFKEKAIELGIFEESGEEKLKKVRDTYIMFMLIIMLFIDGLSNFSAIILWLESVIILYILYNGRTLTNDGKFIYSKILKYKKILEGNELLEDRKIAHEILLEKQYANSVALHFNTKAKKEFINDDIQKRVIKTTIKSLIKFILWILIFGSVVFFKMYLNNEIEIKL